MSERETTIGCRSCGRVLTDEERHYYEDACEDCERDDLDEYMAARKGPPDPVDKSKLH